MQLLSVISLLSSETPNLDSPANVDAAKEVRTDFAGPYQCLFRLFPSLTDRHCSVQKESTPLGPQIC